MQTAAIAERPSQDTDAAFPPMLEQEGIRFPEVPRDVKGTGLNAHVLANLVLKTVQAIPRCTTKWVAGQLHLPLNIVEELLSQMVGDHLVEVLGHEGPFNRRYAATDRGHERALRIMQTAGYV